MGLDGLKWVSIWKNIDFNGFRWVEMGFNMENMDFNGFRWIEIGFNMEKYGFEWVQMD